MNDFSKIFGFFFKYYRGQTLLTIALIVIAGFFEALGLIAFLPFFQLVLEGEASLNHIPEGAFKNFIIEQNIPLNIMSVGLFIAGMLALKAAVLWFALRKVSLTVAHIAANLRQRFLLSLLNAKWNFFTSHPLGISLNAVVNETFTSSMAFLSLARTISSFVQFLIYATGAVLISWKLFLGAAMIGGLLACALWVLVHIARKAGHSQMSLSKQTLNHLAEMLQGIKPIRAMALENKFTTLLLKHSKGLEKAQTDQLVAGQAMRIFHEPLMAVTAIIGLYGIVEYTDLETSVIAVMAVIFVRMLTSMNITQTEYQRLVTSQAALWSLIETIDATESNAENWPGQGRPDETLKSLNIQNVQFSHGENPVLKGVDFDFKPCTLNALIGPSGSGKTTILDLISGFQIQDQGQILINDTPLSNLALKDWRKTLGFVPQEVFLFNDSVIENVLMGRDGFDEKDVMEALQSAGAADFVQAMPEGIHSPVGEGGRKLSGGQRQRIAIARAILHKPQLLLLDEPTSALDPQTERVLLETLKEIAKTTTIILISHNKAVQDYADVVYTLSAGKVTNQGSPS